jgi:hypothetical protein
MAWLHVDPLLMSDFGRCMKHRDGPDFLDVLLNQSIGRPG